MNPTKIKEVHPHQNDKPRQKKFILTDITYLNEGYNAKTPSKTKNDATKKQCLKVHMEPDNSSLAVIIKKEINLYRLSQILTCYMLITG